MRYAILAALTILTTVAPAQAQTHPCDQTSPTNYTIRRNEQGRVGFCHDQKEDDGTPIPLGQLHVYVVNADTATMVRDLGLLAPITGPSAAGYYYFEGTPMTFAADIRLNVAAEYNGMQALAATPIVLDVRGGPKAPTGLRVVISQQ